MHIPDYRLLCSQGMVTRGKFGVNTTYAFPSGLSWWGVQPDPAPNSAVKSIAHSVLTELLCRREAKGSFLWLTWHNLQGQCHQTASTIFTMTQTQLYSITGTPSERVLKERESKRKEGDRQWERERKEWEKESEHINLYTLQMCINCSKMTTNTI